MSIKKTIFGILAAFGLSYFLLMIYVNAFNDCNRNSRAVVGSADGEYTAEYYEHVCEGDSPKVEVVVRKRDANTFFIAFSAISTSMNPVRLEWRSNSDLYISYAKSITPTKLAPTTLGGGYEKISVSYSTYE